MNVNALIVEFTALQGSIALEIDRAFMMGSTPVVWAPLTVILIQLPAVCVFKFFGPTRLKTLRVENVD